MAGEKNRYVQIIEQIFRKYYRKGANEVPFERTDILETAAALGIPLPKNLGDIIYSFRYRAALPNAITKKAKEGYAWIIRPSGRGRYTFVLTKEASFAPSPMLAKTKIPDATPGIVSKYSFDDEQALLAKIRYNRLIDIFTGVTCYSLQNHLRTTLTDIGQVETDEIYVGIDKQGVHYVFPVQAKGPKEQLNIVQIEQDLAMCEHKFPALICRPIGAQFMSQDIIALFEFERGESSVRISCEKHYQLVPHKKVTDKDLQAYRSRPVAQ